MTEVAMDASSSARSALALQIRFSTKPGIEVVLESFPNHCDVRR